MVLSLLRIILILLVLRAVWKLVKGMIEGAGYRRVDGGERPSVKLVRDPVCGVHVLPANALALRSGGHTMYFCSEKCRQAWGQQ